MLLVSMCLVSQVLALAAQELSRPGTQKKAPPAVSASDDLSPRGSGDKPVDWRQEVERRIQSKTRRLTKVVTAFRHMGLFSFFFFSYCTLISRLLISCVLQGVTKALPEATPNRYASLAGHFFFPLLRNYDK